MIFTPPLFKGMWKASRRETFPHPRFVCALPSFAWAIQFIRNGRFLEPNGL